MTVHFIYAVFPHVDFLISILSIREQAIMPAKETVLRKRFVKALDSVQHHLHDSLHVVAVWDLSGDPNAHPPGDGGSNLVRIQHQTLNLRGCDNVMRVRLHCGTLLHIETNGGKYPLQISGGFIHGRKLG
jgi:hypothetical protein